MRRRTAATGAWRIGRVQLLVILQSWTPFSTLYAAIANKDLVGAMIKFILVQVSIS